jgi:hypothetical protein
MAAADQLEWHRALPIRAIRRLGWFVTGGSATVVIAWVLFGTEPERLASGERNPLALVPMLSTVVVAGLLVLLALPLFRRPVVAADHYALTARPGVLRTLMLPWAGVAEIAAVPVRGDPVLLVRCAGRRDRLGDRPRWYDQGVLRSAMRAAGSRRHAVAAFDLAVRMDEFHGSPPEQLAGLAVWAPCHVLVTDGL